jgi:hypothetical protein
MVVDKKFESFYIDDTVCIVKRYIVNFRAVIFWLHATWGSVLGVLVYFLQIYVYESDAPK